MAYDDKKYLLRMSQEEYDLLTNVAKQMRRSIKDAILYSIEKQRDLHLSTSQSEDKK